MVEIPPPPGSSVFKQRWADLIKKVYEADPLLCPRCGSVFTLVNTERQVGAKKALVRAQGPADPPPARR